MITLRYAKDKLLSNCFGSALLVSSLQLIRRAHLCQRRALILFPSGANRVRCAVLPSTFVPGMIVVLGMKAYLNLSALYGAGGNCLFVNCTEFRFSLDNLLQSR